MRALLTMLCTSFWIGCSGGGSSSGTSDAGRDATTTACVPGMSITCGGPNGCTGYQVCKQDGSGYTACACGSSDGSVPGDAGPSDGSPVTDATQDSGSRGSDGSSPPPSDGGPLGDGATNGTLCSTCAAGTRFCNACVSKSDPYFGCATGGMGTGDCSPCYVPHAVPGCDANGKCSIGSCRAGYADCNGSATDGCETYLIDPNNCGACGTQCASGQVCTATGCTASCPFPTTNVGGACLDYSTSNAACGNSNTKCFSLSFGDGVCTVGRCSVQCDPGYTSCAQDGDPGSGCYDTTKDLAHCGSCSGCTITAPANGLLACNTGTCTGTCQFGWTLCGGTCLYLGADPNNCGACGRACATGDICVAGQCAPASSVVVAQGLSQPEDLAIDDTGVYFTSLGDNSVRKVPLDGGTVQTLAPSEASPMRIALDATNAYWSSNLGSAIRAAPKSGTGTPYTVSQSTGRPLGVATDGTYVYWTDSYLERAPVDGGASTNLLGPGNSLGGTPELKLYAGTLYVANNELPGGLIPVPTPNGPVQPSAYTNFGNAGVYITQFDLGGGYVYLTLGQGGGWVSLSDPTDFGSMGDTGNAMAASWCGVFSPWMSTTGASGIEFVARGVQTIPGMAGQFGLPQALVARSPNPRRLVIAGGYIYWTDATSNTVNRVPLPQ